MKKDPSLRQRHKWSQDQPWMQAIITNQAMWGLIQNVNEGLTEPTPKLMKTLENLCEQMHDLIPFLRDGKWE